LLGRRYATLPDGAEKQQALLDLCRCFHPYLIKYLSMICQGYLPLWKGQVNHDARKFIRYFLPKGIKADRGSIQKAIRHLHLAFKGMETEEIYDVLMEQLLAAAAKYDPHYTDKIKQVVGVIEHALSGITEFFAADVDRHLQFTCHRHLRLLCRRGFLVSQSRKEQKRVVYQRTESWPPPARSTFFRGLDVRADR
jgi:hypothetical protein